MARKDDIETAPQPSGAAEALKGLAGRMAAAVNRIADAFITETQGKGSADADKSLRTLAQIARTALSLHQLQAAEDKADDKAVERAVKRVSTAIRARHFNPEEDETDMNDRDPRLDDPDAVDPIYEGARKGVEGLFRDLEIKRADQKPRDAAGGVGPGLELAPEIPPIPTPAHS